MKKSNVTSTKYPKTKTQAGWSSCILLSCTALFPTIDSAKAQSSPVVDLCTGLSANIPILQPVGAAASGLLGGLLDPVLNGIVGDINTNLRGALSGQQLGITAIDRNGNLLNFPSNNCNVAVDKVIVNANRGITLGGGQIDGLGGPNNALASAGEVNAIALGNGAVTSAAASNAIALGLRGSVTGIDGVAIGRDTSVTSSGGAALGAGSIAARNGMSGAAERFSGSAVASTAGAISVGSVGNERQIVNVAGGTLDTDAANIRQLRSVGSQLATSLGGGAGFNSTTGIYSTPTYLVSGVAYYDVATALAAIQVGNSGAVAIAANNTSNFAGPTAQGADALAVGYGAGSSGNLAAAFGTNSSASGVGATAVGSNATASGANALASGRLASASGQQSVALGANSSATQNGSIAIGAGSIASRNGMAGGAENFSGTAVASTVGAMSVGSVGNERQIANVAGGTTDTDAVNIRQLRTVGSNLATSLGGGASFSTTTGAYTAPTYMVSGIAYYDVASALSAVQGGPMNLAIAANNTSRFAAPTAQGSDSLAVGYGASSNGNLASAFGTNASATGNGATALGTNASAIGANATASGQLASAGGASSVATGHQASASGDRSVAVGAGSTAAQSGSTAIGAGASTTRANQVAVGTAQSTYTMAGVGSAQSASAQRGITRLLTTDSAGNIATSSVDINGLDQRVTRLQAETRANLQESRQGIATAMSMDTAPMPSLPGRTSWSVNTATFKGEYAGGFSVAHRFNTYMPLAVTGSYGNSGGNTHGVRVGMAGEF